jgi:arginine/ornithine N-succinyltransferase beta subunit
MALVNQVEKRVRLSTWQVVKYQIITHCYLYDIQVSEADLNCLTFLAIEGDQELTSFCNKAFDKKIFSSTQSVRNCLTKAEKKGLIKKEGKNKKKIYISPDMKVSSNGNVLLDYKFLCIASQES